MNLENYSKNGTARYVGGGGVLALFAIVVLLGTITQYFAAAFDYHPALGSPIVGRLYAPWSWLVWQGQYFDHAPELFGKAYITFFVGVAVIGLAYAFAIAFGARRSKKHFGLHGDSHWATLEEIQNAGLLPSKPDELSRAFICGGWKDGDGKIRYLRHVGPEHMALYAPPRSGKGLSVVVPTLLSTQASVIVYDQKRELWNLTAGWRSSEGGTTCIKFDPSSIEGSAAFNPCEEVRIGTLYEVGDAQNIATMLADPDSKGLKDHFAITAHALLVGVILHEGYRARLKNGFVTLPEVMAAMADPDRPVDDFLNEMLKNKWGPGNTTHIPIAQAARETMNKPDDERGSVISTAQSYLALYRDPILAKNVSRSDFKVTQLANSEKPVSLYLCVSAEDKDRMKPLIKLVVSQIIRILMRPEIKFVNGREVKPHRHGVDVVLDEAMALGKLEVLQESLGYMPGYGVRALIVVQDREQQLEYYGQHTTMPGMCRVTVAFAPTENTTAEWLSAKTGEATVVEDDTSTSGSRTGVWLKNVSHNYRSVKRPLMTPGEIQRLPAAVKEGDKVVAPGNLLIFSAGTAPIYGHQTPFFFDPEFVRRAAIPPPAAIAVLNAQPRHEASPAARFTDILQRRKGRIVDPDTGEITVTETA